MNSLNRTVFSFKDIIAIPEELINKSQLQKAMLFELSVTCAEDILSGSIKIDWDKYLQIASRRQRQHYDARIPNILTEWDIAAAYHAARNLVAMLTTLKKQNAGKTLEHSPLIPGLGWIASGNGDFALGSLLIEVKHTNRNFQSGDIRQVLIYWLLKYARSIETNEKIWSDIIIINPRRNTALLIDYEYLIRSASAQLNRVELIEMLRSAASHGADHR